MSIIKYGSAYIIGGFDMKNNGNKFFAGLIRSNFYLRKVHTHTCIYTNVYRHRYPLSYT